MAAVTGWILILLGAVLGLGGIWLAVAGGSLFYIVMGLGLILSGYLLKRRLSSARLVYAALLLVTLAWALWEVGFDWWQLVPRGLLLSLIGLWLLLPLLGARQMDSDGVLHPSGDVWRGPRGVLAGTIGIVALVAVVAAAEDGFLIDGKLPGASTQPTSAEPFAGNDWPAYGGDKYGRRYSALSDITPANARKLKVAWVFHTGDKKLPTDPGETTYEVTPIKIGDTLYLCTPHNHVIALDPATGTQKWAFDPKISINQTSEHLTCRGVSYHTDPTADISAPCKNRLIVPTMDARLFALDAMTGKTCPDFGNNGQISLMEHMPNPKPGFYMVTSPPMVVGDLAILGAAINDNASANNPSGVVRAFDVHSGKLVWAWDPGAADPNAIPTGDQTYSAGAPNMWSIASADEALGLVYIPLGNKSPDQFGGARTPQVERFSSAVVALEIATGKLRWVFQTVHHDLWDRDVPAQPTLVDLKSSSGVVPALIQPTKQGDLYVLDRRTGKPIFPVREMKVSGTTVPGDFIAQTQPVSSLSYMPPPLREADMWGATPFDQLWCRIRYRAMYYVGPYTPPSFQGTLVYPGNTGVFNWGGVAVDPVRQVLIGSPMWLPFVSKTYKRDDAQTRYVTTGLGAFGENFGGPYAVAQYPFMSPIGVPCPAPPWGSLVGTDLATGKTAWRVRNGTVRDSFPIVPLPLNLGVPSLGGPLVTAGGVFFYSGTLDNYLRAYDVTTGEKLWQGRLPAGGQATPMTYRARDGRQMVVVAAGGHGSFGTKLGDAIVAFALPK